ncbi:MAG TPA: Ig-like domain-containing protein [Stackebrandtia sp.]|uniref:L,D-transpeptidase n=1 Tax=Stackebrandtia sp. TaxID=2023065 RepID=UPI002D48324C|nr:Ig-like domain-containing protein [Stackebrandtia sp.]HZE39612.1 Ig-like domain-containing protein [Stackebrandtia sp.]
MGSGKFKRGYVSVLVGVTALALVSACAEAKVVKPTKEDLKSAADLTVTPRADDTKVPVASEVNINLHNGTLIKASLATKDGKPVAGALREDGTSWVPAKRLAYHSTYTARVTAVDDYHRTVTKTSTFTTMGKPSHRVPATLANTDRATFGKAMPVVLDFPLEFSVSKTQRANVEKRLFVTSEPSQPGVWHWFNGSHLEYRPRHYWKPGTKVSVRLGLGGLPLGHHSYGAQDIRSTFTVDKTDRELTVSDHRKRMLAYKNGKVVRKIPVSLGKPGHESYTGTMVIMSRAPSTVFDTTHEPGCGGHQGGDNCYKVTVQYAERLTWGGQFIHSAPWSVWAQGNTDTSHGCVNVSPSNAKWVYDFVDVGTPVVVKGTGVKLPYMDGYTSFNLSWKKFVAGSALPVPASLAGTN